MPKYGAEYAKIWTRDEINVSKMVTYWEPHISRRKLEKYAIWLKDIGFSGQHILHVVRNACMKRGSAVELDAGNARH